MAKSLENHRDDINTSIKGRRIGLTHDDYLVGFKQHKQVVTNATSATTGTAIPNHGYHTVVTTTNDVWTLTAPAPGVEVTLMTNSTSTGTHAIVPASGTITSTNGVAGSSISMNAAGERITLVGLSTALWGVKELSGAVVSS